MSKFTVTPYVPNARGKLIKAPNRLEIIKHLRKEYYFLGKLLNHKGHVKLDGDWENINIDLTDFSFKYPTVLFEARRLEKAMVKVIKNDVETETEKTLVTIIQVLNGSINLTTISGDEEKETSDEQQVQEIL